MLLDMSGDGASVSDTRYNHVMCKRSSVLFAMIIGLLQATIITRSRRRLRVLVIYIGHGSERDRPKTLAHYNSRLLNEPWKYDAYLLLYNLHIGLHTVYIFMLMKFKKVYNNNKVKWPLFKW